MERKPYRVFVGGPDDYESRTDVLLTEDEADVIRFVADRLNDPVLRRPHLTIEEAA
ncbi:hypothetical protein GA0070618_6671 [Micromonospora echinospora]|uniref:Uncharacterized protein n=1 Tax=Micromonospora echinospora TaxID=1877 RepID=A0A1C5ABI3_MICEC|nr:hypothetical protein [Micromonospora echinospora]SCF42519.1 hypothetical protein GA0070618_6671 [Micromonospora echinospora]